mgnify:CR=1 FL=1
MTRPDDARSGILHGLAPEAAGDARVLILGSLPGAASLARQRYYAHPRNQFWLLVEQATGHPLVALDYAARLEALRRCRIALWDMVAQGTRRGSLDQDLAVAALHDVAGLVAGLPDLALVGFNGTKAAALGRGLILPPGVERIVLPSSSPANTMPLARKLEGWRRIGEVLGA